VRSDTTGGSFPSFSIEPLEGRQLFAATVTPLATEPAAPFIAKINFQPAGAAIPGGYLADTGSSYANRGNGFTYGWSSTNNQAVDRNSSRSMDQRYDTFNRISSTTWSLAVPNGRYVVKLVCGDANDSNATYRVMAEGEMVVDGKATSASRWVSGSAVVDVADGKLTLNNAPGETRNQVNFIEVYQTDLPTTVTVGPENSGGFTRSGPADLLLRPSGSVSNVAKVEFFNNGVKIGEDASAPFGLYYKNVDPGTYSLTTRTTTTGGSVATSTAVPVRVKSAIISQLQIGWSSSVAADRNVGWNIKAEGWQGFVNRYVQPAIAWGATRILLINPFGTKANEPMQLDQFLHAQQEGLTWLTQGFVQAWKPIIDSGIEVIGYVGTMENDSNFTSSNWQTRFWASLKPLLDAGMSIGLDGAGAAAATTKTGQGVQLLRAQGAEVYVEPRPAVTNTAVHRLGVITTEDFWDRSNPERYPDSAWAATDAMIRGEVIRLLSGPPAGKSWAEPSWYPAYMRDILAQGNSAAIGIDLLIHLGVSLEELLA